MEYTIEELKDLLERRIALIENGGTGADSVMETLLEMLDNQRAIMRALLKLLPDQKTKLFGDM